MTTTARCPIATATGVCGRCTRRTNREPTSTPRPPSSASTGAITRNSASVAGRDRVSAAIASTSSWPSANATSTAAAARNTTRPSAGGSSANTTTARTKLTSSAGPRVTTLSTVIGNLHLDHPPSVSTSANLSTLPRGDRPTTSARPRRTRPVCAQPPTRTRSYPQPAARRRAGTGPAMGSWARPTRPPTERNHPVDTLTADDTWDRLGSIAQLLHQAATRVWSEAGRAPTPRCTSLGLGVYLVQAQASALLPDGLPAARRRPARRPRGAQRALQLLTSRRGAHPAATGCTSPDLVNSSQLVVDLCDLIREARDLGC